jgi:2-keto-4-pentenoate hydratase/2-oxohepta-3-ene-1,7-dioic acid hydratase in catechol pathway
MRLIRFGQKGNIKPGLWKDGNIVDLREIFPEIPDISETFFREGWLEKVAEVKDPGRNIEVRIASPIHRPSKIICLGKNYAEHAKEGGFEHPETPLLFCKTPNALSGPYDPIILPRSSGQVDWEVELAVIIGKEGKRINKTDALDYVAGFTVMNDVSGRQAQFSL